MTIRDIDYDTNEDSEKVYSRLTWAVEKVDGLFSQLINGVTVDTNRPWVGTYDKEKMEFRLIEPSGYLSPKFLQVTVQGQIIPDDNKSKINIKLGLGWYPIFVSSIVYLGTIGMLIMIILFGESKDIWTALLWVIVFPGLWTFILNRKMNKVQKKAEQLFGVS
jgi:ABC-type multidrug transport system fused ATPase/permease subunit